LYVIQKDLTSDDKLRLVHFVKQFNIDIIIFDVNDDLFLNAVTLKLNNNHILHIINYIL